MHTTQPHTPNQGRRIRATVISEDGHRTVLAMVCPSRSVAEAAIERLYPAALYVSIIVGR